MAFKLDIRTWFAFVALGPAIYVAIQILPIFRNLLTLMIVAALLTLLISPVADRLERRGFSRGFTAGATLGGVIAILAALVLMLLPILFESLRLLSGALTRLANDLPAQLETTFGLSEFGAFGERLVGDAAAAIQWGLGQIGGTVGQVGAVGFALFVLFVVVFTLVSSKSSAVWVMRLFLPVRYHQRTTQLTHAVSHGLSRWFVAQLAICGYYTIAYTITNLILGVPYGVQIAVVSGLLEFIPYLGGIVGMVLGALAAATVSPTLAVLTLIVNVIIGAIAVYVVAPYAFSKAVEVPVALILLGLFIGGQIGGFFAALLTVPIITAAMVILRELRPDLRPKSSPTQPSSDVPVIPVGQPRDVPGN
ncbi:AI-2E family transporter [Candidatus Chloroploca asiatica]|uniref:AI-2E family transporter n=1 Tax=Candidatus Chloroploca asiatica TaxID=1506545 RepID=A0A2H3KNF4_9CHLR|nr:AI-2E family transporter [Candidatus Chloroploca asiatica]PDV99716.1 hypothetical protein A9Q02_00395 [Candidatus Chloroploca asiatica]